MSNPEIFHVIGYTRDDSQNGGLFRLLWLSRFFLQQMRELCTKLGPLDTAYRAGKVSGKAVEILFYDSLLFW